MNYTRPVIEWGNIRGVIFDMDGTLYRQFLVRFCMSVKLIANVLASKNGWRDLRVVLHYRKNREKLAEERALNIAEIEFRETSQKFNLTEQEVAAIIKEWIDIKALKYLRPARFYNIDKVFDFLNSRGIKIGVFSDYPVEKKLAVLGLAADVVCYSSEPEVNRLKPQPQGLLKTIERMGLERGDCVMIGDRMERDGICAREAGVAFLLCDKPQFYTSLLKDIA